MRTVRRAIKGQELIDAPQDDLRIRRLCTTVLKVIHEMDSLDASFIVDATTKLQPQLGDV